MSKKITHLSYIFLEIKVSGCVHWRGKQKYRITKVGVKSKLVTQNERINTLNVLSYHLNYSHVKNKSVKLLFVTKNSKHLVGTSVDDSSALIEFTPL